MRTGVVVTVMIAAVIIAGGIAAVWMAENASARMIAAAAEATALIEMSDWARTEQTLNAYADDWDQTVRRLEPLIDNERLEKVTDALRSACTGARIEDETMCAEALTTLVDAAQHLAEKERYTLGNLL